MRRYLACLLLLICVPAMAQIYKYTDANGNPAFSNQPPDGAKAEAVELKPLNSVEAQRPAAPVSNPVQNPAEQPVYQRLELTDLPGDATVRANDGTFTLNVAVEPRLQSGHRLQLLVDGSPYGQASNLPKLQVVNLARGEHSFAVVVQDARGVIQQSPNVTLSIMRVAAGRP
ncbi:DUF4124 domain-containing protein [Pseudomonas sp. 3A(2025)]